MAKPRTEDKHQNSAQMKRNQMKNSSINKSHRKSAWKKVVKTHCSEQWALTNWISLLLIHSMHSSRNLNSWLVSKTRISITDFDDFVTCVTLMGTSVTKLHSGFWTEFWSPVLTDNQWLWVCRTLYVYSHLPGSSHNIQQHPDWWFTIGIEQWSHTLEWDC